MTVTSSDLLRLFTQGTDPCQLLRNTIDHLANQPDLADVLTSELAEDTIAEAQEIQAELDQLVKRIRELKQEIEALWADQHRAEYELVSVFIHRGAFVDHVLLEASADFNAQWLRYCAVRPLLYLPARQQESQALAEV